MFFLIPPSVTGKLPYHPKRKALPSSALLPRAARNLPGPLQLAPMVTRWNQKSPGLKILWIWTLGTAGIMIANVVRTRVNDMEMILRDEDEAAAAAGGGSGGGTSGERVMRDDELSSE
ncbi:hypothetical protein BRADI_5g24910v3 [Brachypodium distachyon]|uniref:Uncharacterized protein n=2 Tax=Brachypodium distachyon TaxID=15368 RepID=A0A0Q3EBH4_BRADI|nr:hypothetical protein BRADI_5g24910v3 [Brachypodium distachyon]